jgi:hypothetical protein
VTTTSVAATTSAERTPPASDARFTCDHPCSVSRISTVCRRSDPLHRGAEARCLSTVLISAP